MVVLDGSDLLIREPVSHFPQCEEELKARSVEERRVWSKSLLQKMERLDDLELSQRWLSLPSLIL